MHVKSVARTIKLFVRLTPRFLTIVKWDQCFDVSHRTTESTGPLTYQRPITKPSFRTSACLGGHTSKVNHKIIKNGIIGATVSSGASLLFFAFQKVRVRIPYVWSWAVLAAIGYGLLATKLSIYGKGSAVFSNWKNLLLTLAVFVTVGVYV